MTKVQLRFESTALFCTPDVN